MDQRRCCRSGEEDRISGLPDELLHGILVRLGSTDAAARTSVLSRRWRHVWAHLPELRLVAPPPAAAAAAPATAFLSTVDAALGGYLAPTLDYLGVSHRTEPQGRDVPRRIPAGRMPRIAPWLRFAAERVVGELNLYLCAPQTFLGSTMELVGEEAVLELPVFERAKRIQLHLQYARTTWLRPQASGGQFAALTYLKIHRYVQMDGADLSALVSTRCPCLTDLDLFVTLIVNFDFFIHSNTLHTLNLKVVRTRRLEVVAPRLEELTICVQPKEAHISAPKLVKVDWSGGYDPRLNQFVDVGRTLELLKVSSWASSLTKRFDEVDELNVGIYIDLPDVAEYESFLNGTNKLPKCKSFSLQLYWEHHALVPIMLHLLRSCNSTKRFRVDLCDGGFPPLKLSCLPCCPCRLEESRKIDGIDLCSLEEVEITSFSGSHEQMELLEVISSIAGILKRLVINVRFCRRPKEACEKVRSICHPNIRVEFCGLHD